MHLNEKLIENTETITNIENNIQTNTDNITNLTPVVLYNNSSGSNDTITLSDSAANYKMIDICFFTGINKYYYVKRIESPNGKATELFYTEGSVSSSISLNSVYVFWRDISINGTTIQTNNSKYGLVSLSGNVTASENRVYIYKVIGYK